MDLTGHVVLMVIIKVEFIHRWCCYRTVKNKIYCWPINYNTQFLFELCFKRGSSTYKTKKFVLPSSKMYACVRIA